MPKSITLSVPDGSTMRFCGLMSRWMTPSLVGHLERAAQLLADGEHDRHREGAAALDDVLERLALHQLHRDEVQARHLAEVVRPHHVPVRDLPRQLDLLLEALQRRRLGPHRFGEERLDRDRLLQLAVPGPVHDAHAADAEHALDLVAPREQLAGLEGARRLHRADDGGRGHAAGRRCSGVVAPGRRRAEVLDQLLLRRPAPPPSAGTPRPARRSRRGSAPPPGRVVAVGDAAREPHQRPHRPPDLSRHQPRGAERQHAARPAARASSVRCSSRNPASSALARAQHQVAAQRLAAAVGERRR